MRAIAAGAALFLALALPSAATTGIVESGSTLMYPLITTWARTWSTRAGNVPVETQSTGSGQGVADVISGAAELGVTDAYAVESGGTPAPLLQIPLAIGAVQVNYNLPEVGMGHLRLTGEVLAAMYSGTVRYWDDAAITALNPNLPRPLPHREIEAFHRSDSSGTTFVFSQFLSDSSPTWRAGPGFANHIHWPKGPWSQGVVGNAGVLHACEVMPYSIGYMGVSYRNRTDAAGIGYAAIRNPEGSYVLPTPTTLRAAAYELLPQTPDGARVSLIDAPGADSYPIANYEYAVVRSSETDPATTNALAKFLSWAVAPDGGSSDAYLADVNFSALPANVREMAQVAIENIR